MTYGKLLDEAEALNIQVLEHSFRTKRLKGLYCDGVITINSNAQLTAIEKACVIAEELGHFHTTTGIILNQRNFLNRKQELRARRWAHERLVPLSGLVEASFAGIQAKHELAEFFEVTEEFLIEVLDRYKDKYGLHVTVDRYTIYFDPLFVLELIE